jgi:hypothetical protein
MRRRFLGDLAADFGFLETCGFDPATPCRPLAARFGEPGAKSV